MATYTKEDKEIAHDVLADFMKDEDSLMIASVHSVARSGMSRTISFHVAYTSDSGKVNLSHVTWYIGALLGWTVNKDGYLVVKGCGMDVIYHTLTQVAYTLGEKELPERWRNYIRI